MKTISALIVILVCNLGNAQNVTTIRKPVLKVFSGNYDSKSVDKTAGRMQLEIRQVKTVISGTLTYKSKDTNMTGLKISGYVQNTKAHVQISDKSGNVGSAVLTLEADKLTVAVNGENALLPKNTVLLRI